VVQISFKGKHFVQIHRLAVEGRGLLRGKQASLTDKTSLHDNLIIHGDNPAAIKALLEEQVTCRQAI
jgi:adenine-specific DNA-methyltransferase